MSDKNFWDEFEKNMKLLGLPVPNSLFSTAGVSLATIGSIATAIKTFGAEATLSEIFLTIPFGASSAAAASGASEIVAAAGALSAAFYLGACIGSFIIAVNETYGDWLGSYIASALSKIADDLGLGLSDFIEKTIYANPIASPIRSSVTLARRLA